MVTTLPDQKRQMRKEEKLNENEQDPMLFRAPESCFHHLCLPMLMEIALTCSIKEIAVNAPKRY